jgi:hypothetical protein
MNPDPWLDHTLRIVVEETNRPGPNAIRAHWMESLR